MTDTKLDNDQLVAIARTVHEAVRAWNAAHDKTPLAPWPQAPDWMKSSTMESVLWVLENPDASVSDQHDQWVEQRRRDGWTYGNTRDEALKTHPQIIPFEELSDFERKKDAIVRSLSLTLAEKTV